MDASYDIASINPAARSLLQIRGIAIGKDLVHLARDVPSNELRAGIDEAIAGRRWTGAFKIPSPDLAGRGPAWIRIDTYPLPVEDKATDAAARGAIVVVEDITTATSAARTDAVQRAAERSDSDNVADQARRLLDVNRTLVAENEELRESIMDLRGHSEELLVASEEAQAATEELETLNEELQATNEELETLNEELQATNEELHTTNDDMQSRTHELQETAASLEQLQGSTEAERARFAAVLASMRDAVAVIDPSGSAVLQNDAYSRLVEHGEPVPEEDEGHALPRERGLRQRAAHGETFTTEFRAVDEQSDRRWYEVVGQPIDIRDAGLGGVLVIRDITERSLRRLQNEFVAIVAHELRTPLKALRGYLQLLQSQPAPSADSRPDRFTALAVEQADRLQELIADLFDTARMDSGKLSFRYAEVDLSAVIREAVDIAENLSDRHVINVQTPVEPLPVRADPGRVQQVLLNVLSNAITHATGSDRIDVHVDRADGWAVVSVVDGGPGIPPDELLQLFARYRQGSAPGRGGLGLGLFISREIVTAHGGTIEAVSAPATGTTIRLRLPLLLDERAGRPGSRRKPAAATCGDRASDRAATPAPRPSRRRGARASSTDQSGEGT